MSSRFSGRAEADRLEEAMRRLGTPEYAEGAKRYLKSSLTFFGTRSPDVQSVVRGFLGDHPDLSRTQLLAVVRALWKEPIHERRLAAINLLQRRTALLERGDVALLERLLRGSKTWAYVDPLSVDVGGQMWVAGTLGARVLDGWSRDDDFWIRRASLLVLLKPVKSGRDFDRFSRYAERMLDEKEFFIRKAIGWVLRERSKQDPEQVRAWVEPRLERMSGVTRREATKYLADLG